MTKKKRSFTVGLTVIYAILVVWIILFKMVSFSDLTTLAHPRAINWIPFYYEEEQPYHMSEVVNNVLIFIPVGVYLEMLRWKNTKAILGGLVFSLTLELMQFLLAVGVTDITDLITNTAGTVIGVCGYGVLLWIFRNREKLDHILCALAAVCTLLLTLFLSFCS